MRSTTLLRSKNNPPRAALALATLIFVFPTATIPSIAAATLAIDLRSYGVTGDGIHDDSVALQRAIDSNKGKQVIIPPDMTVLAAGIRLDGPDYDGTTITVEGRFRLLPDMGRSTISGAWIGLLIRNCSNVTISGHFDGNRIAMSDREHIFAIALAGARSTSMPWITFSEIRGDGLYVSSENFSAPSAASDSLKIGTMIATNSSDDGRNALSLISASHVSIDTLISERVGATVEGRIQPGGFDIEPNAAWQSVTDVNIRHLRVETRANSGIGIIGRPNATHSGNPVNVHDVVIDDFKLLRTGPIRTGLLLLSASKVKLTGTVAFRDTHGSAVTGGDFRSTTVNLLAVSNSDIVDVGRRGPVQDSIVTYPESNCAISQPRDPAPGLRLIPTCTTP